MPEYQQMQKLAEELQKLDLQMPYVTEQDKERDRKSQELRQRVLMLLAQDRGLDRVDANLAEAGTYGYAVATVRPDGTAASGKACSGA